MHQDEDSNPCGFVPGRDEDYNMALHVGAIFIILACSLAGSALPVLSQKFSCTKQMTFIMQFVNAFGVGVVISTALVHMLPPANEALNNECLNMSYSGLANVIAVVAVMLMQWLQTELTARLTTTTCVEEGTPTVDAKGFESPSHHSEFHSHGHIHASPVNPSSRKISVLIFELGVAIHSVIIGLNLGVASGTTFTTLLTAICFHQFFEGVAVGSSALLAFDEMKSTLVTIVGFTLTTPVGIVIGIGISTTYSSTSTSALWVQGCLDALAGGILLYTGIVELLTNQYTNNPEFHAKSTSTRLFTYAFVAAAFLNQHVMSEVHASQPIVLTFDDSHHRAMVAYERSHRVPIIEERFNLSGAEVLRLELVHASTSKVRFGASVYVVATTKYEKRYLRGCSFSRKLKWTSRLTSKCEFRIVSLECHTGSLHLNEAFTLESVMWPFWYVAFAPKRTMGELGTLNLRYHSQQAMQFYALDGILRMRRKTMQSREPSLAATERDTSFFESFWQTCPDDILNLRILYLRAIVHCKNDIVLSVDQFSFYIFPTMTALDEADDCGAIPGRADDYNMSLHIAAIFIVLAFSLSGSMLPVVSKYFSCMKQINAIMEYVNAFGVGVVIATSLVHMLPPANESLNSPCLNLSYGGLANVIAVVAILIMQWLQTELLVKFAPSTTTEKNSHRT
ncbi:Zinc (Zn2)-Iron (Fe2) Permease (ZIP) Family [Thraustotheca clavata]|uniref:Zinc (Zn2)-Iron (Fe2) Permease (ZIP) Family n=1 Tax=Thraustotheca clavata TaxID=74557 RepID=A0A1W0A155_9STRA|nr:Zinc (Zn2)-Iron (Fe2) Permease (ZIP) Family [Thraustotheca clavata]